MVREEPLCFYNMIGCSLTPLILLECSSSNNNNNN